jgi:Spy/CpxP family protein refolding chaperone
MRNFSVLALLIFLVTPVAAAPEQRGARSGLYQETASVWDELEHQFKSMRDRFRERFGGSRDQPDERPLISMMLNRREELNLSSDQVKNLERLRTDFEREAVKNQADLRVAELDLSEILNADSVDVKKAEVKVREIERLRADLRLGRIRAIEQGKAVLSQEQREKLRSMMGGSRYSRRPEGT